MKNHVRTVGLALLAVGSALAQPAAAPPSFEVASVKASEAPQGGREGGGRGMAMGMALGGRGRGNIQVSPDSLTMRNTTLKNAIRWAYHVTEYQVSGPEWMDSTRFNIVAKSSGPATDEQLQAMTQTLLAERFKLALHRQTKEFQVYVLTPGKNGAKLQESTGEGEASIDTQRDRMTVVVQRTPISQMVDLLTPLLGAPVLDMTGLKGKYDVTVNIADFAAEMAGGGAQPDPVSIVTAVLERKMGLKLESRKMVLDTLVIDHAEKTPTEN